MFRIFEVWGTCIVVKTVQNFLDTLRYPVRIIAEWILGRLLKFVGMFQLWLKWDYSNGYFA
jgi:hypothetical protein